MTTDIVTGRLMEVFVFHPPSILQRAPHVISRLVLVTALLGPLGTHPARAQSPRRAPILEDYYRLETVGAPALSPDGRRVAYVRTTIVEEENRSASELWLVSVDDPSDAHRLTTPAFGASSPRWSPDGTLLAFNSNRPTGSNWFLRMDRPAGEAFQIDGVGGTPVFSPDNEWIAFTKATDSPPREAVDDRSEFETTTDERFDGRIYDWMNYRFDRRGYLPDPRDPEASPPREVYVVPRAGGEPRQLTTLGVNVSGIAWRPDGRALAFTADEFERDEHTYERADLWTIGLDGTLARLTNDGYHYRNPSWSPEGESVVVVGSAGLDMVIGARQAHGAPIDLYVIRAAGEPPRNITRDFDLMPGAPAWSPDGRHVYFSSGIGGNSHLFRIPSSGRAVEQITTGDRRTRGITFSSGFERIAYRATDPMRPGDIYTALIDGGSERQLTRSNEALLAEWRLSATERITYRSADGTEVEGWVVRPHDADPNEHHPLVLSIHGGPHGAYGNDFSLSRQLLAANGYFVLFTNPRGSTGYGEDFKWAIWGGWGVLDYQDLMAGVDHVIDRYPIDVERMGVTGYSYGGFMTNWVIGHTNRFAAAAAGASISNWVSDYGTADIPRTKESEFFGPPWEKESRDLMIELSPITYAGNVATPTLFVHGEYDHRVPIEEAEQMYTALKKNKVPAMFIRYPESYHGGWSHWRTVHRWQSELRWWERWLGEEPKT